MQENAFCPPAENPDL